MSHRIGDRVKALREKADLTQEQLEKKAGLGKEYVRRIEGQKPGYTNPRLGTINDIANALDVHPSVIIYGKIKEPIIKPTKDGKHTVILSDGENKLIQNYRKIRLQSAKTIAENIVECISVKQKSKSKR